MRGIVISLFAVSICTANLLAQGPCVFTIDQAIPDNDELLVEVDIDGLVNDDLSAGQAICAVRIKFRHNYVGDLTVVLTSPSGQSVKLIGEPTDMINPTNLTTWDITFLPCSFAASPDAGFSATWDNDQDWQVFTTYNGTYYPTSGCLEDINTGSANGTWQFSFVDNDLQATGIVEEIQIVFCDGTGLMCSICTADGGQFPQSTVSVCDGDNVDPALFDPVFTGSEPQDSLYGYRYFVSIDGISYVLADDIGGTGWPVGQYTICGLSFLSEDSTNLFDHLDTLTFQELRDEYDSGDALFCSELTAPCVTFTVNPVPDTEFIQETICRGESYTVGNNVFTETGVYTVDLITPYGCDSTVVLDLTVRRFGISITQRDTLSCDLTTTRLDATGSNPGPGATYMWSTANGVITGNPNQPVINIAAPGRYSLTVTDAFGCTATASWQTISNGSFPFVSITSGTITCNSPVHRFNTVAFPTNVTYAWSGPGGFTSNAKNPPVSMAGQYVLTVTDTSGCSVSAIGNVLVDTATLPVDILVNKRCDILRTTLTISPTAGSYNWTGPGGFSSNLQSISVNVAGAYVATRTMPNGCTSSSSRVIDTDYQIPDVSIVSTADTLNCAEQIELSAISSIPGNNYTWFDPNNIRISNDSTADAEQNGIYRVRVQSQNMCEVEATYEIFRGDDLFSIDVFADTLTCAQDTVLIGAFFTTVADNVTWTGPGLVDTNEQFIRVDQSGIYQVRIVDTSGCIGVSSVEVIGDYNAIPFQTITDTLTCTESQGQITYLPNWEVASVRWEKDGFYLGSDSVLIVDEPGRYFVTLAGNNGCPRTRFADVIKDTMPPLLFIEPASIGCEDSVQLSIILVDSIASYDWQGPGGFQSSEKNPFVYLPGSYSLTAIGVNGCEGTFPGLVKDISVTPDLQVQAELLDCIDSSAVLAATSADTLIDYGWYHQGVMISDTLDVTVDQPGMYTAFIRSAYTKCTAVDSVEVLPAVHPPVFAQGDTLNCKDTVVRLIATSDSSGITYTWYNEAGNILSNGAMADVQVAGTFTVEGTWTNGCSSDTSVVVEIDTLHPVAVAMTDEEIRCEIRTITLNGSASIGDSLAFAWSTFDGHILAGQMRDSATVEGPGTYMLMVTNMANFCTDQDSIEIQELPSTLTSMELTIVPECQGNGGGTIIIDTVNTALSSLWYTIGVNGGSSDPVFDGLAQGMYTISVVDSFGCELDSTVAVTNTSSEATVNLGPDIDIVVGDPVVLSATLDIDSSALSGISWDPVMPCDSCLSNLVTGILETQDFEIQVADAFGCVATDEVTVFVVERGQIYIPNVFSPNGDGTNDHVRITAHPGVKRIVTLKFYDRWGNLMFGRDDFTPDDPSGWWDGKYNGEDLNPAVYAYYIEIELVTGRIERRSGDITLVR